MVNTDTGGSNAVPANDESRLEDEAQANQPSELDEEDSDDRELREALAALKAEGEGDETDTAPEQNQQQTDDLGQGQEDGNDGRQEPQSVPYPRFVEVNSKATALAEENAYLKGQLDARTSGNGQAQATGDQQQSVAEPDPAEELNAINKQLDDLAGKFDDGELTAREWRQQERELNAKLDALQAPADPVAGSQEPVVTPQGDSAYLAVQTRDLDAEFPRVNEMSDEHFSRLEADVTRQMIAEGDPMVGEASTLALRTRIAMNAERMEQIYIAQDEALAGVQPSPQAQPVKPGVTPQQRADKRALAASMPPDLDRLPGSADGGDQAVTETSMEGLSDDEIAALPEATRARFRGMSA